MKQSGIRRSEAGSAIPFVIVAVVLLTLLGGAAFVLKQRSDQAHEQKATDIAKQQESLQESKDTPRGEVSTNDGSVAAPGENENADNETLPGATTPQNSSSTKLPTTGPADGIGALAVVLLAFTIASYVQSRRTAYRATRGLFDI